MLGAQALELTQRLAGRPTQLGMMPFALELGEHDERQHHGVLVEPEQRLGVGQDDGRVDDVRLLARHRAGIECARRRRTGIGHGAPTGSGTPALRRWLSARDEQLAREAGVGHVHDASGADGSLPIMKHPPARRGWMVVVPDDAGREGSCAVHRRSRMAAVRDPDCAFCSIVADEAPAHVVLRDDVGVAFLDRAAGVQGPRPVGAPTTTSRRWPTCRPATSGPTSTAPSDWPPRWRRASVRRDPSWRSTTG